MSHNIIGVGNSVIGFTYNDSKYIFKKNLQNDIIGIYNEYNNLIASYVYDAWGNHKVYGSNGVENTSTTFIGNINPFRYRSYYYDRESKLYYCKARYYNPELCRWMSLDSIEYLEEDRIIGISVVVDFENGMLDWYWHQGYTLGPLPNTFALTGSVRGVHNYNGEGSYSGPFKNFGGGYWIGFDHCFDPRYPHSETCWASSVTYGNNFGVYFGYDEFYHMGSYKW